MIRYVRPFKFYRRYSVLIEKYNASLKKLLRKGISFRRPASSGVKLPLSYKTRETKG